MSENIKKNAKKTETRRWNRIFRKPKKRLSQTKNKDLPMDQVLHLQRTIGNRAVARLIKSGAIQAKLKIDRVSRLTLNQPNDIYEKEADNVADRVMSMKDGALVQKESAEEEKEGVQTKPLAEQITPLIQRQAEEKEEVQSKLQRQAEEEEEKEPIQTKLIQRQGTEEEEEAQTKLQRQPEEEEEEQAQPKAAPGGTPKVAPNIESNINSMKGGGQPLSESARSFFEPRFGTDFSQVRVHTDEKAGKIARSINARAFTTGKDVVFSSGQYSPGTSSGKRLLAHELTHVLQQKTQSSNDRHLGLIQASPGRRHRSCNRNSRTLPHMYNFKFRNLFNKPQLCLAHNNMVIDITSFWNPAPRWGRHRINKFDMTLYLVIARGTGVRNKGTKKITIGIPKNNVEFKNLRTKGTYFIRLGPISPTDHKARVAGTVNIKRVY